MINLIRVLVQEESRIVYSINNLFFGIDTPIGLKAIEHFQVPLSLLFKASLSAKLWQFVPLSICE